MLKKTIIASFLLLFAHVCFTQPADGWYNGKPIIGVQFQGLKNVNSSTLDEIFKPYKNTLFSDDVYWEILGKIYALDYFSEIVPQARPADDEYSSVYLEFTIVEKPSVKEIIFIGNNQIRNKDLQGSIAIKKGDIYNETVMKNAERSLKDFYKDKGFAKAEIISKAIEHKEDNNITIEYSIKEGKLSIISSILFEGNSKFPEKALKKVLISKEAKFIQKGIFKEDALQADKEAIKVLYGEHGYIDAHVETIKKDIDDTTDPEREQLTLTYIIMEGDQYKYTGTTFQGNYIFTSEDLGSKIKLQAGDIFNLRKFELGFNAVIDLYFENGYTGNYVDKKEIRNEASKEVGYNILIVERERSHIEQIIIKGNKKTKDYVIFRELLLKEGDVFSRTKFLNSFRNLYNLRYFSSIVPEVLPGSEQDLVDIVVNVEEQGTATVNFGVTLSGTSDPNTFPMSVFVQWEEKNLLGTGRELSANVNAATDIQSLMLGFTENWFLGTPLSVGFNFSISHRTLFSPQDIRYPFSVIDPYISMEEYEKNPSLASLYQMKYEQLEFGIGTHSGYRWFPKFAVITLRGGFDFGIVKNFYNNKLYRPFDEKIRSQQARWRLSNSFWTKLSLDNRDIAHDPSTGWFFSQGATFVGLLPKLEDEYYFQADTKAEWYLKLLDYPVSEIWNLKFVLGFYSGFSFQIPIGQPTVSFDRQLYIDGTFTGRGWLGLGPEGRGQVMQNNWIEFRWPLAHGILSFDFFLDAIAVKKDLHELKKLSINDYYFSFGPGLRFSIPQFPLRLMFANTFRSKDWKPHWGNGRGADWRFVLSFNIPNI